jgi:hypothetical protein
MKPRRMHWIGHAGYWAAAALIVLMAWFLYRATVSVQRQTQLMDHSVEVLATASEMGEAMSRANAAQLSFLLSLDEGFVERRERSFDEGLDRLGRLGRLTVDDPGMQAMVKSLEKLVGERRLLMLNDERIRRGAEPSRWPDPAHAASSAAIASLYDGLRQGGLASLLVHRIELQRVTRDVLMELGLAVLAAVALMIPAYIAYSRHARARVDDEGMVEGTAMVAEPAASRGTPPAHEGVA